MMSEEELKILEKQLSHFIKWLGNNRPYQEGLLYGDMKDYLARLNQNKDDDTKRKREAIAFAEFVSNFPVFDDFWSMSKEHQEKIYQQFLNQNKDE